MISNDRNIYVAFICLTLFAFLVSYNLYVLNNIDKAYAQVVTTDIGTSNANFDLYIERMEKQAADFILESKNKQIKSVRDADKKENKQPSLQEPIEKYKQSDLKLLAQLIESESGNQPFEGKLAVGTVVMNRVESDEFPDTIREVIYQKRQFSPVADGSINNKPSTDSLKAAKKILEGLRVLKSNVLYFYNPDIATDKWIRTLKVKKTIGDHVFAV